ncbi:thiamine pyrophosphate-dependent enzyme [Actinoalloteichus hymeniacidonis]|uniref:Pyruvate dehydrogenase (Acetyl-transferring) beta subunit n=1 Tax=Actinoalloteichus hymeniacidonis TaxID=340345 RepID=A0AAC9HS10_9PSEU|nr:thiamine pyrophosphate-dependent enzyme [Actinoalloteichus hymeniacidonis]AOS64383.1 pyruvate dehydrogenase (acetyl-transferring) beta subunit [Actinoalloteichus hymeniacidonis]MBB5907549.1 2-oxoisovalerate dehydrogenase E1 component [Actinoalloteichus hymeniacidonis]
MTKNPVDEYFLTEIAGLSPVAAVDPADPIPGHPELTGTRLLGMFDSQVGSRHLDLAARALGAAGKGFYSIGSSGHEGNASVAAALRPTDPALLHYRSGAFFLERAGQVPGQRPLRDVLLGVVAASAEPISGGRHKVFGHRDLDIIPQTSTIASHLPRAVGLAFALERAKALGIDSERPADAVVVCSFGDASANHSTATGAINAALHCAYQGVGLPLLFVCEDNGIGISVRTPTDWIARSHRDLPGMTYLEADGSDLPAAFAVAKQAVAEVRRERRPVFLRLSTVRLMGHAGSDLESGYRSRSEINADYTRDPVTATARLLVGLGIATPQQLLDRYAALRAEVSDLATEVVGLPKLASAAEVMRPLAPISPIETAARAAVAAPAGRRATAFPDGLPESEGPLTLAQSINRALADLLLVDPGALIFGEDVARKGGVYGVTKGLQQRFGRRRVFDTLLDEQSVLGTALGAGLAGLLPIPEIQYLAYLHNAADQLRGEAASLRFFSAGQYRNPMVVRVAGLGYQKGFGGHFHNDNGLAALRDIPGLIVASPSRPDDAAAMLRTCAASARTDGSVCVFLEPIALYHQRDLHEAGDGDWAASYPAPGDPTMGQTPLGRARRYGDGPDLTLVSFGNGVRMSLRVARRLAEQGVGARVLDLRWLAPLPVDDLLAEAAATGRVLIVDETRRSGGVSESVVTALVDRGFDGRISRVTSEDSFIPLGAAAELVLLDEATIEAAAVRLLM